MSLPDTSINLECVYNKKSPGKSLHTLSDLFKPESIPDICCSIDYWLKKKSALVITDSLSVAASVADSMLSNILSYAAYIFFPNAIPEQAGFGHTYIQSPFYWTIKISNCTFHHESSTSDEKK